MKLIHRVFIGLTLFSLGNACFADAAAIENLERSIKTTQQKIAQDTADIKSYREKLEEVKAEVTEAEQELASAEVDFNAASTAHDADPSSENERSLRRASDLKKLAERKVQLKQNRAEWLENEIKLVNGRIAKSRKAVVQEQDQIAQIKVDWQKKINQQEAAENKKAQAAAEIAEKARQDKALAEKRKAEQALAAEREAALAAAKTDNQSVDVSGVKTPEVVEQAPSDVAAVNTSLKAAPEQQDLSHSERKVIEYNDYLSGNVSKDAKIKRLSAYSEKSGRIRFKHLGGEIYRAQAELEKGEQIVRFDGSAFRVVIDEEDDEKVHMLYFDNRDSEKRSLVVVRG